MNLSGSDYPSACSAQGKNQHAAPERRQLSVGKATPPPFCLFRPLPYHVEFKHHKVRKGLKNQWFFLFWKLQTPLFKMKCPGATFKKPRKAEMATGLFPPCLLWVNAKILWENCLLSYRWKGWADILWSKSILVKFCLFLFYTLFCSLWIRISVSGHWNLF